MNYTIQKETGGEYTVWELSLHTGSKIGVLGWFSSKRSAEAFIRKQQKLHEPPRPKKMTRFDELTNATSEAGIFVATWSPGDGVTRYRFFTRAGNSYSGPDNGVYTALGLKDAWLFVQAYGAGSTTLMRRQR